MNDTCGIWEKFETDKNLVKEYQHWIIIVRKNHATLGACVAITKEHHESLGDLSPEEMAEYQIVAKDLESALKSAFNYDVIYHLVTMKKDKHTHFHIFPRYQESREFAGAVWADDYDSMPVGRKNIMPQEVLDKVKDKIRQELGK